MKERMIVYSDNVILSYHMAFRHRQGPVSKSCWLVHDVLDGSPFILCWEEKPVIMDLWIGKPLAGELSLSAGSFKQLLCQIPHISPHPHWIALQFILWLLTANELVCMTRCKCTPYSKYLLLYEGQLTTFKSSWKMYLLNYLCQT